MNNQDKISNEKKNWYIAEIIEKCEPVKRNEEQDLRRVKTWGNFHLIKAKDAKEAYDKAINIGKSGEYIFLNSDNLEMEWAFVGIADLIPIYDDNIEDGCEIMFEDYGFITNKRALKFALPENELLEKIEKSKEIR
ncbi:protein of unknown function [Flavobacterium aquidurense]|uniref:DUF4288 domain-containing protein n=1 Tax=Flavobacterium frigidimaris TaxID=262320 RepID=A0ABX4BS97_FLAFR|nr:DUF4288 domain-containing protein [Flavobacterium frigidimaris]OXA79650.1 hypothetical protein B0A65_09805 [Flavobacterium frigidimaris]SDZ18463.1 protein of unknown function [Flavobacterium aquidurense]